MQRGLAIFNGSGSVRYGMNASCILFFEAPGILFFGGVAQSFSNLLRPVSCEINFASTTSLLREFAISVHEYAPVFSGHTNKKRGNKESVIPFANIIHCHLSSLFESLHLTIVLHHCTLRKSHLYL